MFPLSRSWASLTVLLLLFLITAGAQPVFQYDNDRLRVLNCPVALNGGEPPSGCDASSYEVTRFTWVAPSIIGAVAVLIFFVSYFVGKYACNCCGGRRQSANFCIPHPHLPAKYSKDDLLRPVFLAALCTVLFATSCIWGCSSTTTLLHAVGELDQRVGATVQQLNGFIHTSTTAMNAMTAYNATTQQTEVTSLAKVAAAHGITSSAPALAHTSSAVAELLQAMWGSTTTTLRRRVDHFVWAIYVLQILLLLVSMVGLLVAVFHCRQYVSMIMVVVFCALGGLMWLALGVNLSLDFLLRDSCAEVEYFGTQAANVVSSASGCNQTLLATYPLAYATASQELVQASCRTMLPFCYVAPVEDGIFQLKVLNCPEDMLAALENPSQACNSSLSIGTWRTWMRTSFTITSDITNNPTFAGVAKQLGAHCINGGPEVVCNIDACANQCLQQPSQEPSLLARAAREVLSYHQVLQRLTYVQATSVATLGTCIGVLELTVPPIIHTCTQVVAASDRVRQACGLAALVVLLSIMAFVLGAKRFMPLRQALLPQTN